MDNQRDLGAPAGAAVVASGGGQRDWLCLHPAWRDPAGCGGDRREAISLGVRDPARDALTSARLLAWVERLRGGDRSLAAEPAFETVADLGLGTLAEPATADRAEAIADPGRERGIPASALVPVGRGPSREAQRPAAPPSPPAAPAADLRLPRGKLRLRRVPSSPNVRFVLLCLAAFFFAAGVAHSFARWKPVRVIVVPETENLRSVIT